MKHFFVIERDLLKKGAIHFVIWLLILPVFFSLPYISPFTNAGFEQLYPRNMRDLWGIIILFILFKFIRTLTVIKFDIDEDEKLPTEVMHDFAKSTSRTSGLLIALLALATIMSPWHQLALAFIIYILLWQQSHRRYRELKELSNKELTKKPH